jgi:hypothetical protein
MPTASSKAELVGSNVPRFLLSLMAIQAALNAVYDIRALFLIDRGQSDAATIARLFFLSSWVWVTVWIGLSVAMLARHHADNERAPLNSQPRWRAAT